MTDINIYGVLHNDTPENTVAKAGQIRDDELEMQQSEINADFKKKIDDLQKGGTSTISTDGETIAEVELSDGGKAIGIPNRKPDTNLGYVILKKNKSLIEQITEANTIYEVRYSYDLGGETLTMPENCVLKFEGGIISNGTINGNKTSIVAPICKIFGDNLNFSEDAGSFYIDFVYAEWWGCIGRFPEGSYINATYPQDAAANETTMSLPDCAPYFNKAFEFAHRYSCAVKSLGCSYAVRSTINILDNTTFITEENTVFCVYGKGEGKTIVTQDVDTALLSSETVDEIPFYLKQNQYIATEAMFVAFNVSSCRVKLIGRGTINTVRSQCAIGLLVKSRDYETLDMSYFLHIDLRFVGGAFGEQAGDSKFYTYGHGAPTDSTTNQTGSTLYYVDVDSIDSTPIFEGVRFKRYQKSNNKNTWSTSGNCYRRLNTDIRFEMSEGGAGGRLIDPHIRIGCMFGFRGVELLAHDGGWFNISTWEGTISNKYGNFISIFTDGAIESHDFSGVSMQWGQSNWETCCFYAIKTKGITIGASADLSYTAPKIEVGFYFGKFTSDCIQTWIDDISYVVDLGEDNDVGYNIMFDKQTLAGTSWVNQWSKRLPTNLGFMKIDSIKTVEEVEEVIDNVDDFTIEDYYPFLFDDDDETYETIIDTDNNIYGTYFLIDKSNDEKAMSKEWAYIEIDFCIVGSKANYYEDGTFNIMLFANGYIKGNSGVHVLKPIIQETTYITTRLPYIQRMFIPIRKDIHTSGRLAIFTTKNQEKIQLQVYGIKLWTTNAAPADKFTYRKFYPKNSFIIAEENSIFYNTGDAKNNNFVNTSDNNKMDNEIIIPIIISSAKKTCYITVQPYLTGHSSYELIDEKGYISAKLNNGTISNNANFPGGYNNGYRKVEFITTGIPEDYTYPYVFKVKLKSVCGITVNGYYKTNLIDIIRQGIKEITIKSIGGTEDGELLLNGDDISNHVSDIRVLDLSLLKNVESNNVKAKINTISLNKIEYININKSIKLYGNIALLSDRLYYLYVVDGTDLTYNTINGSKSWKSDFSRLYISNANSFTTDMVDALLIDLSNSIIYTEASIKQITLLKTIGGRTSASDSAVEKLESLGFTVTITQQ